MPIWLILIRIELPIPCLIPSLKMRVLVTKTSSPTICTPLPRRLVSSFQPSQSPSAMPSSIETIGKRSARLAR
ncbi:MAG: hypothetical protein AW07_02010 [Candidatus Accumulibacter sp. SK-11]|nr:MAG: hypothetical protein AW07_02010 [Candidatus Accumulibacter sp. SK-11]